VKVTIDRDTCPELFEQNPDDSFSRIIEKYRIDGNIAQGRLPGDLEACAEEAADLCPVQIIAVDE
jgi:ferredoxin